MSLNTVTLMQKSASLRSRITAAVAAVDVLNPEQWANDQIWFLVTDPAWETAWDSALKQSDNTKINPDTGARDDVISDTMIKDAVAARRTALQALEPDNVGPTP